MAITVKRKYIVEAYGQPDKEFESADEAVRYAENNNGKSVTEFYSEYNGDRLTNTEPPVEIWCDGDDYCECDGCEEDNAFGVDFPDSDIASIDSSDDADYDAMAYAYVEDSVNDWADDKKFIQEAVADLEENEDEVECKGCFELFPKGECVKTDHGYVCKECLKVESLEGTVDKDLGDDRTPEKTVQDKPTELTDGTAMRKHEKAIDEELKVIVDFSDYKPWQGAKETYDLIEDAGKLDELEEYLEECYPDGITATQINDLLWFDGESVLRYLGLGDEEDEEVDESLKEAKKDEDELPPDPAAVKLEVHQELNNLVNDEIEAINGYEEAKADIVDKPIEHKDEIINTINHIEDEEKEHIDELISATSEIPFEGGHEAVADRPAPAVQPLADESFSEHVNEERPAIESDQKLKGADCAVVDCQTDQKLIAHSEDEKPLDCKMKKKPLDKPLTEGIIDGKISRYIRKRLADKKLSLSFKDNNKGGLGWQSIKTKNGTLVQDIPAAKVDALIKAAQAYSKKPGIEIALTFKDGEDNKTIAIYKAGKIIENKLKGIKTDRAAEDAVNALDDSQSNGETIDIKSDNKPAADVKPEETSKEKPTPAKETPATSEEKPMAIKKSDVVTKLKGIKTKTGGNLSGATIDRIVNALGEVGINMTESLADDPFNQEDDEERFTPEEQAENDCDEFGCANKGYDQFHHCGWCGEVYPEYDMRKEVDFGWLCDRCEAAIKSRGEHLTFVEDLNEASTAEKRAYKNGGEDLDDLLIGKTVAAIDTPSVKKAVGNALRNGDPKNVAELKKLLRNDPRAGAAVDSYIKKAGAMQRAGVVAESADESLKEETSKNIRYAIGYCYWDYGWYEELAEKNSDGTQCGTTHADNYFYNNRVYDGKTFDSVDACIAEVKANVAKYAPLTYPENIDYAGGRKNGSLYAIGLNEAQNGFVSRKIIFDCKAHKLVPHKD